MPTLLFLVALTVGQPAAPEPKANKLIVATRVVPPFAMKDEDGNWSGISIDLLRQAFKAGPNGGVLEFELREYGLAEMLDAVAAGEVDLAAAALTVNVEREERMDFSHPFHTSGLGIATEKGRYGGWAAPLAQILRGPLLRVLAGLAVALLISGGVIYLVERRRNPEQFGGPLYQGLGAGVWWSIVTLTTVGYGDKAPKTLIGRLLAVVWMLSGLLIISGFTAAVSSALTVGQLRSLVGGPADLPSVRVATVANSTSADYLASRRINAQTVADVNQSLQQLADGEVDAVVYDAPVLRYQVLREFPSLQVLPVSFERQDYALALPAGSPLRESLNRRLLRVVGSVEWERTVRSYVGNP